MTEPQPRRGVCGRGQDGKGGAYVGWAWPRHLLGCHGAAGPGSRMRRRAPESVVERRFGPLGEKGRRVGCVGSGGFGRLLRAQEEEGAGLSGRQPNDGSGVCVSSPID